MLYDILVLFIVHEWGVAEGAIEVVGGGGEDEDVEDGGASPPVVIFDDVVVAFEGLIVTGIPHILDSVVLTGLSLEDGLLGSHIAAFVQVLMTKHLPELELFQILLAILQ